MLSLALLGKQSSSVLAEPHAAGRSVAVGTHELRLSSAHALKVTSIDKSYQTQSVVRLICWIYKNRKNCYSIRNKKLHFSPFCMSRLSRETTSSLMSIIPDDSLSNDTVRVLLCPFPIIEKTEKKKIKFPWRLSGSKRGAHQLDSLPVQKVPAIRFNSIHFATKRFDSKRIHLERKVRSQNIRGKHHVAQRSIVSVHQSNTRPSGRC